MKVFKLETFGSFQLSVDNQPINRFRTYKVRDLLIYLTVKANRPHQRDHLAALLWSDYPDKVARTNLRNALAQLRKILNPVLVDDPAFLVANRQIIQLNLNQKAHSADAHTIERILATYQRHAHPNDLLCGACAEQLTQIGSLYQGEFLSGLNQTGSTLFDEWRLQQQEHYHRQMKLVYKALTQHHFHKCDYAQAEQYARDQLRLEPWLEEAHQQLMQALALNQQRAAALVQYDICRQVLAKELKVGPSPKTDRLVEQIRTKSLSEYVGDLEKRAPATPASSNLPAVMTPFFGREAELEQLSQLLLDPAYRLITLVGSGGIGKTRLASTTAEQALPHFEDGVWFVSLIGVGLSSNRQPESEKAEALSVEDTIATAIAEAVNLTFYESTSPKTQLLTYLHQKNLLLVLDNFEHLLNGVNLIIEILNNASTVSLLVTSRKQFSLQAEYVLQIEGLSVPSLGSLDQSRIQSNSSVQLFAERADRTRRGFTLNDENYEDVTRICRFLEGFPLGIELAASWVKMMSCADIAQAVEQNLDFLSTSKHDVSSRHRSLRMVFEQSWQVLSKQEQHVLGQISIFRGNFSQEAADFIAEATPIILASLVDRSLVQLIMPGRYQLHELLRQFAAEKLTELSHQSDLSVRLKHTETRHGRYYLNFVQERKQALNNHQARAALSEIRQEITNIRHAWQWAVTHLEINLIKQSLDALSNFYYFTGLFEEGIRACELAAEKIQSSGSLAPDQQSVLGSLLVKQAVFLTEQAKAEQAILVVQTALYLGRNIQSTAIIAASYLWWGRALLRQGKFEAAKMQFEKSRSCTQENLPHIEAYNLRSLSNICFIQGNYSQCPTYLKQTLDIYHKLNNQREEAATLSNLGQVMIYLGHYQQALEYFEQALPMLQETGNRLAEAITLEAFGNLHYRLKNFQLSKPYFEMALKIYEQLGDQEGIGYALTYLANISLEQGELEVAHQTYCQALQVRQKAKQFHLISEDQAGLAKVALLNGKLNLAQSYVEEILGFLEQHTLKGEDIFRIYLTCYQVLRANQDARAQKIINMAYQHLQTQAGKIEDKALQQSFLENITLHREVLYEWRLMNSVLLQQ